MDFEIYFPLFDDILYGSLRPELPANAEGHHYMARLQTQILPQTTPAGQYAIRFPAPVNSKTSWYSRQLINETNLYCADAVEFLSEITDERERSYWRDQILDKHLTSCLQIVGEQLRLKEYCWATFCNPTAEDGQETLSNIYIYHLLKVCVAKAFLEIQFLLPDVISWKQTEMQLYQGLAGEQPPVSLFLVKRPAQQLPPTTTGKKEQPVTTQKSYVDESTLQTITKEVAESQEEYLTVQDIAKIMKKDNRTILRRIESGKLKAIKDGRNYLIHRDDFEMYRDSLK